MPQSAELVFHGSITAGVGAFLFLLLFIVFLMPFFHGIVNTGGIIGAALSGTLSAAFFFHSLTLRLIGRIASTFPGKLLLIAATVLAAAFAVYAAAVSVLMYRAARNSPGGEDTTLVILGCKVRNGKPSRMLRRRLDTAAAYLSKHERTFAVVSGGKGNDETVSEAQCMKNFLTAEGIAPEKIFSEDRSTDTAENIRNSAKLIEQTGLPAEITIVTDGFHQYRAALLAERAGLRCHSLSAKTSWWLMPTYCLREWLAVGKCLVFRSR